MSPALRQMTARYQQIGWPISALAGLLVIGLTWLSLPLGVIGFIGFLYLQLLVQQQGDFLPFVGTLDAEAIVAPIEGVISSIEHKSDAIIITFTGQATSSQICYSPVNGVVEDVLWIDGEFTDPHDNLWAVHAARHECVIDMGRDPIILCLMGTKWTRYLTLSYTQGQSINRGEPCGLSLLRSTIRLIIPAHYNIAVLEGQRVLGGQTVIANR